MYFVYTLVICTRAWECHIHVYLCNIYHVCMCLYTSLYICIYIPWMYTCTYVFIKRYIDTYIHGKCMYVSIYLFIHMYKEVSKVYKYICIKRYIVHMYLYTLEVYMSICIHVIRVCICTCYSIVHASRLFLTFWGGI